MSTGLLVTMGQIVMTKYNYSILLTSDCNLRCSYCSHKDETHSLVMSEEHFKTILTRLNDYDNTILTLSGGEPLLQAKLILKFLPELSRYYQVIICSNGSLLRDHPELEQLDNLSWNISVDNGSKDKFFSLNNIHELSYLTRPLGLSMVVTPESVSTLYDSVMNYISCAPHCYFSYQMMSPYIWLHKGNQQILVDQITRLYREYISNPKLIYIVKDLTGALFHKFPSKNFGIGTFFYNDTLISFQPSSMPTPFIKKFQCLGCPIRDFKNDMRCGINIEDPVLQMVTDKNDLLCLMLNCYTEAFSNLSINEQIQLREVFN